MCLKNWMNLCSPMERLYAELALEQDGSSAPFLALFLYVLKASERGYFCVYIDGTTLKPDFPEVFPDRIDEEIALQNDWKNELISSLQLGCVFPSWISSSWFREEFALLYVLGKHFLLHRFRGIAQSLYDHLERIRSFKEVRPWSTELRSKERLSLEQQQVWKILRQQKIALLLGGPGTGKSFTAACVIEEALLQGDKVALLAPTGKAIIALQKRVRVMPGQVCYAATIHHILRIFHGPPAHCVRRPIAFDFVVIDESSMIDALTFADLLGAIPHSARVLCIGDPAQLAPVEIGGAFSLLIEWGERNDGITALGTVIRTDVQALLNLSQAVFRGNEESSLKILRNSSSIRWLDTSVPVFWSKILCEEIFPDWIEAWIYASPEEAFSLMMQYKILTPLRVGPHGAQAANEYITNFLFKRCLERGCPNFCLPIMVTKNFPQISVANGDQGILWVENATHTKLFSAPLVDVWLLVKGTLRKCTIPAKYVCYAWAISVHKSQGSEFEHVIFVLPKPGAKMITKQLIYTGITRAKKELTVWSESEQWKEGLSNEATVPEHGIMRLLEEQDTTKKERTIVREFLKP